MGEQSISFTQVDAAKNTSDMSDSFKFTIVAEVNSSDIDETLDVQSLLLNSSNNDDLDDLLSQFDTPSSGLMKSKTMSLPQFEISADAFNPMDTALHSDPWLIG